MSVQAFSAAHASSGSSGATGSSASSGNGSGSSSGGGISGNSGISGSISSSDTATKVAIIGCGALGLNYGTRLLEAQLQGANLDVNLVLRRDFGLVSQRGLLVEYGQPEEVRYMPRQSSPRHLEL
jgi:hypothetical protein